MSLCSSLRGGVVLPAPSFAATAKVAVPGWLMEGALNSTAYVFPRHQGECVSRRAPVGIGYLHRHTLHAAEVVRDVRLHSHSTARHNRSIGLHCQAGDGWRRSIRHSPTAPATTATAEYHG